MIESINNNGGGGGGVQTVVAGTGISIDNTDPENPIVTNTVTDTDDKVRVSSNDTTAGYLNGKLVAGSGIGFTENNNGLNETLTVAVSNLDASAITTGTVATARLGTGTANSTTYLRGDQTWASVAAGDTTYTVTTADAENTTNDTSIITLTVPANTWADNEIVFIEALLHINNGTGSTANLTTSIYTSGVQRSTYTAGQITGTNTHTFLRQYFYRQGSNIRTALATEQRTFGAVAGGNWTNSAYWNISTTGSYAATFTSDIQLQFRAQWNTANSTIYVRVFNARGYKQSGQFS